MGLPVGKVVLSMYSISLTTSLIYIGHTVHMMTETTGDWITGRRMMGRWRRRDNERWIVNGDDGTMNDG